MDFRAYMIEYIVKMVILGHGTKGVHDGRLCPIWEFFINSLIRQLYCTYKALFKNSTFFKKLHTEKLATWDRAKKEELDGTHESKKLLVGLWGGEGFGIFETLSEVSLLYRVEK